MCSKNMIHILKVFMATTTDFGTEVREGSAGIVCNYDSLSVGKLIEQTLRNS